MGSQQSAPEIPDPAPGSVLSTPTQGLPLESTEAKRSSTPHVGQGSTERAPRPTKSAHIVTAQDTVSSSASVPSRLNANTTAPRRPFQQTDPVSSQGPVEQTNTTPSQCCKHPVLGLSHPSMQGTRSPDARSQSSVVPLQHCEPRPLSVVDTRLAATAAPRPSNKPAPSPVAHSPSLPQVRSATMPSPNSEPVVPNTASRHLSTNSPAQRPASQVSPRQQKLGTPKPLQGTNTRSAAATVPLLPISLPPKPPQRAPPPKSGAMPPSTRPVKTSENQHSSRATTQPDQLGQRQLSNIGGSASSRGPTDSAQIVFGSVNSDRVSAPNTSAAPKVVAAPKSTTISVFGSLPVERASTSAATSHPTAKPAQKRSSLNVKKLFQDPSGAATGSTPDSSLNVKKLFQNPSGATTVPAPEKKRSATPPLIPSAGAWRRTQQRQSDASSPSAVARSVCALLNALTVERFDTISDKVIAQVNQSDGERGGETLLRVTQLVFDAGSVDARRAEQYAQLCKKMTRRVSVKVREKGAQNAGKHVRVVSGQLFHQRLVVLCQESCERTCRAQGTGDIAAAKGQPSSPLAPDHVAQKARQRGLGVARFVGELFRSRIISERVMQECVQKLIGVVEAHPAEEEVERLCTLLTTGGPSLESPKALAYMANVFSRLKVLQKRPSLSPRARFMLLDVIEVRKSARTARHTNPTSGGVSLGTPTGGVDGHAATNLSHVRKRSDKSQPQNVKVETPPATSTSPRPVSSVSSPNRGAENGVPSPTTITPSLSPSTLSSPSSSLAPSPIVSLGSLGGLGISGPSSMGISASPLSGSEKPASCPPAIPPSSSRLDSLPTVAPVVHLPSGEVNAPAGLQEDKVQKLRILLKDISTDMLDRVVTEITAVAKDQGGSLTEVLALVIDAAIDEPFSSDMYALLCQKTIEQDESARCSGEIGKLASRRVFRAQVLKQCQERLEHEWPHEDDAATNGTDISLGQTTPYSGDDAAHRDPDPEPKRRALNLIKFISELLKSQILTERIMHDSIERLLPDVGIPSDEEIECLCDILTNVGYLLDTPDASTHMHNYFARMAGLAQSPYINLRMQVMLQNVIDSHGRSGIAPQEPVSKPSVGSGIETENRNPTMQTMIDGEVQAGDNPDLGDSIRGDDASSSEPSRPVRARSANLPQARREGMHSTPAAVMEAHSISSSSSTMLPTSQLPQLIQDSSLANPRHQSLGVDALGGGDFPDDMECPPEYSATLDHPSQISPAPDVITSSESNGGKDEKACDGCQQSTGEEPKIHLSAEVKQIFVLRDLDKGEAYLRQLPSRHHWRWVHKLVASAVASNSIPDVRLVGDLFYRVVSKNLVLPDAFVAGFTPSLDTLDIVISNTPNAPSLVAIMLKAAQLDSERLTGLVHQVEGSDLDMLIGLLL